MRKPYTPEQRAERSAKVKALAAAVAALTPEQRAAFASRSPVVTIEGHALSFRNAFILVMQLGASVSIVGGYQQWRRAGRQVRKGEHGAVILVPSVKGGAAADGDETAAPADVRFLSATVFDITQTDSIE